MIDLSKKEIRYAGINPVFRHQNGVLLEVITSMNYDKEAEHVIYIGTLPRSCYKSDGSCKPEYGNVHSYGHYYKPYSKKVKPYIWLFDIENNHDYSYHFSLSLKKAIEQIPSDSVTIIADGYGATIAMQASGFPKIKQIIGIRPAIQGSPLYDLELLKQKRFVHFINWMLYSKYEKMVNSKHQYIKEMISGIWREEALSLEKITLYGNAVDLDKKSLFSNYVQIKQAQIIYEMTGKQNDGTYVWEEEELKTQGFSKVLQLENTTTCLPSHFELECIKPLKQ